MLNLTNFNESVKTLIVLGPPSQLEVEQRYKGKIVSSELTTKQVTTKKGQPLQIVEALVSVGESRPFKASVISVDAKEFAKNASVDHEVEIYISQVGNYRNASI
jgi:hypothetical protein